MSYSAGLQAIINERDEDKNRTLYSVRGTVINHDFQEEQQWIFFKKRTPRIHVLLDEEQLVEIRKDGVYSGPVIKISFDDEEQRDGYPIGTEVDITFGQANAHDIGFGAKALKVMDIQAKI